MTPYYQDDYATIYHGDCHEISPSVIHDLTVTDPPYGINLDTARTSKQPKLDKRGKRRTGIDHRRIVGDTSLFDPRPWLTKPCAFSGANYFASHLPRSGRWHVWDKTGRGQQPTGLNNEFEMLWTSWASGRGVIIPILWAGFDRVNNHPDSFTHPSQKPTSLFVWILKSAPSGTVLDPFMGSGTTLRAAKDLGRKSIGIEIDERYCEIAARRLAQEVLDFGSVA